MDDPALAQLLELARDAARAAGRLLTSGRQAVVSEKASPRDLVTDVDRASEALIVSALLGRRPGDGVVGEEGTARASRSGVNWIIDPLDGTANYVHGLPAVGVSIAAELDGRTVVGVVHDPFRRETFTAIRGCGTRLNRRPIRASTRSELGSALLGTGFSHDLRTRSRQLEVLRTLAMRVRDVRHSGSAALDLCAIAAGRLDVYYEADLKVWDRAAGTLIAAEAGAVVTGAGADEPSDEMTIAGAPLLVAEVRAVLAG